MKGVALYTNKVDMFRKLVNLRNCEAFSFKFRCFRVIDKAILFERNLKNAAVLA